VRLIEALAKAEANGWYIPRRLERTDQRAPAGWRGLWADDVLDNDGKITNIKEDT
jgi:hypothetical protein